MMGVHTYLDSYVKRDPKDQSTQPKAINPRRKTIRKEDDDNVTDAEKIDPFGDNPGWSEDWVKAHKINYLGRVVNLVVFGVFSIVFWGIALSHYYSDVNILDIKPPTYG